MDDNPVVAQNSPPIYTKPNLLSNPLEAVFFEL